MVFSAFPSIPPEIASQMALVTTFLTIVLLVIVELKSHDDEIESPFPSFLLYPIITVFGLLVVESIVRQLLKL